MSRQSHFNPSVVGVFVQVGRLRKRHTDLGDACFLTKFLLKSQRLLTTLGINQDTTLMNKHEKINYLEFPARDIEAIKHFFTLAFDWSFVDYGPEYTAFSDEGIDGGFFKSDLSSSTENGSVLVVFYSNDIEKTQSKIQKAGGTVVKALFPFPGGHRFHFCDPNGNEYAVWSHA